MKKILLAATALALMGALSGCVSYPAAPNGAWAGYDVDFDNGYHGYDRPLFGENYDAQGYDGGYGPAPYGYPPAPGYPRYDYGPQGSGYGPYDCPPELRRR